MVRVGMLAGSAGRSILQPGVVFLGLALLSGCLQFLSGAWGSDFGGHADEGAHVVTSLMVRDYLAGGWMQQWNPVRFAEDYYELFPKVAIGHYPPMFYVLGSLFLLPFRHPEALLLLMVFLNALLGFVTWRLGKYIYDDDFAAFCAAVTVCLLPLTRMYTVTVMADLLLVVFCVLAVHSFALFLERGISRDSLFFGFWAALAILTKGSGMALALVPIFAIPLSGKLKRFKDYRLWLAPIPVVLLALPWMLVTWKISAEGIYHGSWLDYVKMAVPFYSSRFLEELWWIVSLLLFGSIVFVVWDLKKGRKVPEGMASVIALVLSVAVIVIGIPTGLDERYLLPLVPTVILSCVWTCGRMREWIPISLQVCLPLFVTFGVLLPTWRNVEKKYTGASQALGTVLREIAQRESHTSRLNLLAISDAKGEGALTAAAAFSGPETVRVLRGTKVLSESDWMARGYSLKFETSEELFQIVSGEEIQVVIVEALPTVPVLEHWKRASSFFSEAVGSSVGKPESFTSMRKRGQETSFLVYPVLRE